MDLRDQFASCLAAGVLKDVMSTDSHTFEIIAQKVYQMADALIKESQKVEWEIAPSDATHWEIGPKYTKASWMKLSSDGKWYFWYDCPYDGSSGQWHECTNQPMDYRINRMASRPNGTA